MTMTMTAHHPLVTLVLLILSSLCLVAFATASSSFSKQPHPSSKLRVCQVLVVHRHGDRTPITPLKNEDYWQSALPERHVLEGIARGTTLVRPPTQSDSSSSSSSSQRPHAATGRGPFGQLTMMGLLQMIRLGERLRSELELSPSQHANHNDNDDDDSADEEPQFINRGKLFTPHQPLHPNKVKVMSTDFPRTIQSVQAVLTGLFPNNGTMNVDDDDAPPPPPIIIDLQHTNTYFIPDPQPRQHPQQLELESHLSQRRHLIERDVELQHLASRISAELDEHLGEGAHGISFGIGEEKKENDDEVVGRQQRKPPPLAWAQLCEILVCLHSHSLLPPSLSHEDVEAVSRHVAWRWFENLRHPVLAKSSMWKFASSIVETMQRKVGRSIIWGCL